MNAPSGAQKRGPGSNPRSGASDSTTARKPRSSREPERPTVGEWVAAQATNLDALRRDAARHIVGRWDPSGAWFDYARVLRTLETEDSPFLMGAQILAADYAETFNLSATDEVKTSGGVGPLIPIGRIRCVEPKADGSQCTRYGVPGNDKCWQHGGMWVSQTELERVSAHVSEKLMMATDRAYRTVVDLMDNGKSEMVRLQAALGVFDRAGIGPVSKVELEVTSAAEQAAAEVLRRIEELSNGVAESAEQIANGGS